MTSASQAPNVVESGRVSFPPPALARNQKGSSRNQAASAELLPRCELPPLTARRTRLGLASSSRNANTLLPPRQQPHRLWFLLQFALPIRLQWAVSTLLLEK